MTNKISRKKTVNTPASVASLEEFDALYLPESNVWRAAGLSSHSRSEQLGEKLAERVVQGMADRLMKELAAGAP